MKKYLILLLLIIPINVLGLELNSNNYILYNLTDDQVLIEQNSNEKIYVASLTKIATAIVAIENIDDLEEKIVIPEEGLEGLAAANASVAGFKLGQTVTYKDLLYGLMFPSGGDAAQTLAFYIAGSDDAFVKLMNEFAKKLELETTNFVNTTGLYNENHYSSVNDVTKILKYALQNEEFKELFNETKYLISDTSLTFEPSYISILRSQELDNNFITGGKTGFINQAGYCFASTATINGLEFMLITTDADHEARIPYHIKDALNVYQDLNDNYKYTYIYNEGDILKYIDTENSSKHQYNVKALDSFQYYTNSDFDIKKIEYEYIGDELLSPATNKGIIGKINVIYNDEIINTVDVEYDGSLNYSLSGFVTIYWPYILGAGIFLIIIIPALLKRKKRR